MHAYYKSQKMIKNLFERYKNMNGGLRPKELSLYLPYSKRVVSVVVYFDARRDVFASLLSFPTPNKDENFFLFQHGKEDATFSEPSKSPDLGEIDSGLCYRRSYEHLRGRF